MEPSPVTPLVLRLLGQLLLHDLQKPLPQVPHKKIPKLVVTWWEIAPRDLTQHLLSLVALK